MTREEWVYYDDKWDEDEGIYTDGYRYLCSKYDEPKDYLDESGCIWDLMKILYLLKRFG